MNTSKHDDTLLAPAGSFREGVRHSVYATLHN